MLSTTLLVASILGVAQACSTVSGVAMTFYGYPDNDPPGPATAYNCGGRNNIAGGDGSFNNPLTFATAPGEYSQCEIVYSSYLKKYLRMEDYCAQCTTDWNSGIKHIDIWTGSSTSNGGQNQINCENSLTPNNGQQVLRAPPNNLPVDSMYLNSIITWSHTDMTSSYRPLQRRTVPHWQRLQWQHSFMLRRRRRRWRMPDWM